MSSCYCNFVNCYNRFIRKSITSYICPCVQAQFAQIRATGGISSLPSGIPGFHPGARVSPQQMYYGQGNPGLAPPQPAGYGFQPQLMSGMRPGMGPNFLMPYQFQRQGQPGPRSGMRRGGNSQPLPQQQVTFFIILDYPKITKVLQG